MRWQGNEADWLELPTSLQTSDQVLTLLLAGGKGKRLYPLTRDHSKPMVPFGGIYRLIDLPLSNCLNSGLRKIYILTQHKALSLHLHLRYTWNILSPEVGEFIEILSPTRRLRDTWYLGTADAVYQNIQSIEEERLPYVLILSSDHVYKMNYLSMLRYHIEQGADATVATTQIEPEEAVRFGIVRARPDSCITGFEEKPKHGDPTRSCFNPESCSASMGIYLFSTQTLLEALREDAADPSSAHDFGHSILPALVNRCRVVAYDFVDENRKAARYWRDVGTLDAFYEANMDLVSVNPEFNLYDDQWPIRMAAPKSPPAKFVLSENERRMGVATDSLVSHGCIVSGGRVRNSVLSPGVRIHSYCDIDCSILLPNVIVGRHSRIRHAILDERTLIPEGSTIGFDPKADREAGYLVTDSGVVVVSNDCRGEAFDEEHVAPRASSQAV